MEKTLKAQQQEVQILEDITEELTNNQFIISADAQGIKKYEAMLGIEVLDDDTLENRRLRVLAKWNNAIPYTTHALKKKLENLCGEEGYVLELLNLEYKIKVRVALKSKKNYRMVERLLGEVIPANMEIDLSLLYNQHKTLRQFTHGQLTAYTHNQIRNEVLNDGD